MKWPTVKLGDVFEIARGGSPRPIDDFITDEPIGYNWVTISDATSSGKIIYHTKRKIKPEGLGKTREVHPGDFILSNSMSFGRPYIMGIDGCIHDGWLLLRPRESNLNADFFYHLLSSPDVYSEFSRLAAGATVKNLNSELVRNVEIPLPPLSEQKRIAAILDEADSLRRLRARALEKLGELGGAVFQEMFGDILVNGKLTALGELTSKIGSGATPKGGEAAYKEAGIPLIRSMNVRNGSFDRKGLAYIDEEQAAALDNVRVRANDVLLNITGASVARVTRAPEDMENARVNQHVSIIRPKAEIRPEYLEAYLLMPNVQRELLQIAEAGATRQAITKAQIEKFEIPLISLDLQHLFVERLNRVNHLIDVALTKQTKLETLFRSLQQRAFRGEL